MQITLRKIAAILNKLQHNVIPSVIVEVSNSQAYKLQPYMIVNKDATKVVEEVASKSTEEFLKKLRSLQNILIVSSLLNTLYSL